MEGEITSQATESSIDYLSKLDLSSRPASFLNELNTRIASELSKREETTKQEANAAINTKLLLNLIPIKSTAINIPFISEKSIVRMLSNEGYKVYCSEPNPADYFFIKAILSSEKFQNVDSIIATAGAKGYLSKSKILRPKSQALREYIDGLSVAAGNSGNAPFVLGALSRVLKTMVGVTGLFSMNTDNMTVDDFKGRLKSEMEYLNMMINTSSASIVGNIGVTRETVPRAEVSVLVLPKLRDGIFMNYGADTLINSILVQEDIPETNSVSLKELKLVVSNTDITIIFTDSTNHEMLENISKEYNKRFSVFDGTVVISEHDLKYQPRSDDSISKEVKELKEFYGG